MPSMMATFLLLLSATTVNAATSGAALGLTVGYDATFSITLNGQPWLSGGEVRVGHLSSSVGTLTLIGGASATMGADAMGWYNATTFRWGASPTAAPLMITSFRTYEADAGVITFEQLFPAALNFTAMGAQTPLRVLGTPLRDSGASYVATDGPSASTLFPGFARGAGGPSDARPCFSYHGVFPQLKACTVATYAETHQGGSPLVLYEPDTDGVPTTVFSQLSSPKAQHLSASGSAFGAGVKATTAVIEAGWSGLTILSAGKGVSDGMMAWGDRMLRWSGKWPRADKYRDVTHSSIGFWTDNGGYYHYATGNASETYEDVLPKVKASHDAAGVRFRHWQFDSWFYPKDGAVDPGGGGGGVVNWTAMPSVFPSEMTNPHTGGMAAISEKLGHMPMIMHNRQWSPRSDYIHNLSFTWQTGPKWAMADNPAAFFTWFFQQQPGWSLVMYERAWMPLMASECTSECPWEPL